MSAQQPSSDDIKLQKKIAALKTSLPKFPKPSRNLDAAAMKFFQDSQKAHESFMRQLDQIKASANSWEKIEKQINELHQLYQKSLEDTIRSLYVITRMEEVSDSKKSNIIRNHVEILKKHMETMQASLNTGKDGIKALLTDLKGQAEKRREQEEVNRRKLEEQAERVATKRREQEEINRRNLEARHARESKQLADRHESELGRQVAVEMTDLSSTKSLDSSGTQKSMPSIPKETSLVESQEALRRKALEDRHAKERKELEDRQAFERLPAPEQRKIQLVRQLEDNKKKYKNPFILSWVNANTIFMFGLAEIGFMNMHLNKKPQTKEPFKRITEPTSILTKRAAQLPTETQASSEPKDSVKPTPLTTAFDSRKSNVSSLGNKEPEPATPTSPAASASESTPTTDPKTAPPRSKPSA